VFGVTFRGGVLTRRNHTDELDDRDVAELAALADGSLAPDRRVALEARVAASPELAGLFAEQQRAVSLARSASVQVDAPPSLRARIPERQSARRRPRTGQLLLVGAVAAAVVAVAVGLALNPSSSPESYRAALAPTELAPGAAGGATLTKTSSGWRIELDATGLPRLDGGRFYEAWLRNGAGVVVPVGTFNEGQDVTLWAGVSPLDFPTLTVTRERADGEQASSGEKVLDGTVDTGG
jgi:hypothetical protein